MLRTSLILLLLVQAAFAGSELKKPTTTRRLEVYIAGIMPSAGGADHRRVTVTDDMLVLSIDAAKEKPDGSIWWGLSVTEKRLKLAPEKAKKLWTEIERLRLFDWRESYSPEDVGATVFDGMYWSVSLELGGRSMKSSGTNTYPLMEPFAAPTVDVMKPTAFHRLQDLLRPLEEEANQLPEPSAASGRGSP